MFYANDGRYKKRGTDNIYDFSVIIPRVMQKEWGNSITVKRELIIFSGYGIMR